MIDDFVLGWACDEGTGTTIHDASGNGHDGTLSDGDISLIAGKIGAGALRIGPDGDGYVTFAPIDLGQIHSVALWVYVHETGDGVMIGGAPGNYAPYFDATDLYYSASGDHTNTPHGGLADGWHHLAITRGGSQGSTVRFYKDGVLIGTKTPFSTSTLTLDRLGQYDTGGFPTQADVDEVRFYSRELTAADVAELYAYTGASGTVEQEIGTVATTEVAQALAGRKVRAVATAADTTAVGVLGRRKQSAVTPATDVSSPRALLASKVRAVSTAVERDTVIAFALAAAAAAITILTARGRALRALSSRSKLASTIGDRRA